MCNIAIAHNREEKMARRIGLIRRTAPPARNQEARSVGEDPARSEITGSSDNDDCDHAERRCGVARQLENSAHKFSSPTHRWSIPTHWFIAYAREKCNSAIVHNRTFAHKLPLVVNCKANLYSYIMRVDG